METKTYMETKKQWCVVCQEWAETIGKEGMKGCFNCWNPTMTKEELLEASDNSPDEGDL